MPLSRRLQDSERLLRLMARREVPPGKRLLRAMADRIAENVAEAERLESRA